MLYSGFDIGVETKHPARFIYFRWVGFLGWILFLPIKKGKKKKKPTKNKNTSFSDKMSQAEWQPVICGRDIFLTPYFKTLDATDISKRSCALPAKRED